jgi:hypothetical protein
VAARKITGRALGQALHAAGLIPGELEDISRIVIDIPAAGPALMYVEYYADEGWLDVVRSFDGIEIRASR